MGERVTGKAANQPASHAVDEAKVQYLTYRQLWFEAYLLARWAEEIRNVLPVKVKVEGQAGQITGHGRMGLEPREKTNASI